MTMRLGVTKFHDMDERTHYRGGLDENEIGKMIAKMLREITHLKPPRGRQGRLLDQDQHICVQMTNTMLNTYRTGGSTKTNIKQGKISFQGEIARLESKEGPYGRTVNPAVTDNEDDLKNLMALNVKFQKKQALSGAVRNLSELMTGLMGYGISEVQYEEIGYRGTDYEASFSLDNKFHVIIREKG